MKQRCSAFGCSVHLGLSSLVAHLRRVYSTHGVVTRTLGTQTDRHNAVRGTKGAGCKPRKTLEQDIGTQKLKTSVYGKESIFPGLKLHDTPRELQFSEPKVTRNYYDIRDKRDQIPSPGFGKGDARSRLSNRDDATEEIDIDLESGVGRHRIEEVESIRVKLNKRCLVTKGPITVDVPVNKLTGKDVVNALLYSMPQYADCTSVESLYKKIHEKDVNNASRVAIMHVDTATVNHLQAHICLLARTRMLKLREAMTIALIFDAQRWLEPTLRDALVVALQSQLYAFRPYDIAAAVTVFGKYGDRYKALLNTVGLVFYDLMIAGKTSVTADGGPSMEEMIAVLNSYARAQFPVKRVIDAGFGRLYDYCCTDTMSRGQMIRVLDDFFALSKDANFVELYTKIMAILFKQPLLFVDRFQSWAEEQLQTDIHTQTPAEKQSNTMMEVINVDDDDVGVVANVLVDDNVDYDHDDYYSPNEVLCIMRALSVCNSEYLVQSVHNRIAFKRLWSDNINKRIMPWQGPVVEPLLGETNTQKEMHPMIESRGKHTINAYVNHDLNLRGDVLGIVGSKKDKETGNRDVVTNIVHDDSSIVAGNDVVKSSVNEQEESTPTKNMEIVSYRDRLPPLYNSILKMVTDALNFVPHPTQYLKRIYDGNCRIIDKAISKYPWLREMREDMEGMCLPCYPFKASLNAFAKMYEDTESVTVQSTGMIPFFKKSGCFTDEKEHDIINDESIQLLHAQRLTKAIVEALAKEEDVAKSIYQEDIAELPVITKESLTEEALHCISLGRCTQVNGDNVELVEASANDLGSAISVVSDYSRYSDENHDKTIAVLGALYFRMLFIMPPVAIEDGHSSNVSSFQKFVDAVTPRNLMVECPYLPFTENRNMMRETQFHRTGHGEYRFYRPSPLYTDLVSGNTGLYGLMMYNLAHKIEHSIIRESTDDSPTFSYVKTLATALQRVLHPFYLMVGARTNPLLKWQMLYYDGCLDTCHVYNSMMNSSNAEKVYPECNSNNRNGLEISKQSLAETDENGTKEDFTGSIMNTTCEDMQNLSSMVDATLDKAVDTVTKGVGETMQCPFFRHAASIFVNSYIRWANKVIEEVSEDRSLLSLREYADLSAAVSMIIAFEELLNDTHGRYRIETMMRLKDRITDFILCELAEKGKVDIGDVTAFSASPVGSDRSVGDDVYKGRAEFVETLSLQLDRETFMRTTHALCMTFKATDDGFVDILYSMMQIMYKRLQYMPHRDLVCAMMTLCDLNVFMGCIEECNVEDHLGRVAQMVRILRAQALELMATPSAHRGDADSLSAVGRWEMQRWLG